MAKTAGERLSELGIVLPAAPKPVAAYVGYVRQGDLLFVSGQLPFVDGKLAYSGLLGRDVSVEDGAKAARICAITLVAQANAACEGDLERVTRLVRLGGFVACTPDFFDHPKVINGASELMAEIFGERGQHARAAVGCPALPLNAAVEIEAVFAIS